MYFVSKSVQECQTFFYIQEQDAENIGAGVGVEEVEKHDDETTEEFFQCAVCRQNFLGQVDFFVHLKSHYEPAEQKNTPGTGEYKLNKMCSVRNYDSKRFSQILILFSLVHFIYGLRTGKS